MKVTFFVLSGVIIFSGACKMQSAPVGYPASAPLSNKETREQDVKINTEIEKQLANRGLRDVRVRADSDRIVLLGYVDSDEEKARAEQIARASSGGREITNLITVSKPPPINTNKPGGPREKLSEPRQR